MGYGTSLGTAHEDEISYVMEKGLTDKQLSDQSEINQNTRSGDFQSRFSATDASTMPLEASRKLADALKQSGGTQVPENVEKVNQRSIVDKLTGLDGGERFQTWPERLARSAFTLPGDVLSGKVQPGSIQEIERAADLAGLVISGPAPVAAKFADGTLGSFAGVKSRTLPKDKLYEAQNMELDAMHPDDIWQKTGFFRGADQRWRYEISDRDAKLKLEAFDKVITLGKPEGTIAGLEKWTSVSGTEDQFNIVPKKPPEYSLTDQFDSWIKGEDKFKPLILREVIDHPELLKAYPELGTMKVEPLPAFLEKSGIKGQVSGDTIYLAQGHPEYIKSVLLHEIQHGIQHHEGFAYGGNQEQFLPRELPQAEKEFTKVKAEIEPKIAEALKETGLSVQQYKQAVIAEKLGEMAPEYERRVLFLKQEHPLEYKRLSNIIEGEVLIRQAKEEAYTKYTRLMGEVEARNVQARKDMSDFQRQRISPRQQEDTPRHLQINPK